jgi:hypothetical protein
VQIPDENISNMINKIMWVVYMIATPASWILLLKNWARAREFYCVPAVLLVFMSFIGGSINGAGITGALCAFGTIFYGFVIACLYFSPIAGLFHKSKANEDAAK